MSKQVVLECHGLSRLFGGGRAAYVALQDVTLSFSRGECCALVGPSGSGKTTLLAILGCLLAPTHGKVLLDRRAIDYSRQAHLCRIRRHRIGYVFQHARLLPFLTARENLNVFGRNAGIAPRSLRDRIETLLADLGLAQHRDRWPEELSGGERQRLAVARALLHDPEILLADEPTGALDAQNGQNTMRLLIDQARRRNMAFITVTHDTRVISLFDRIIRIDSGRISE